MTSAIANSCASSFTSTLATGVTTVVAIMATITGAAGLILAFVGGGAAYQRHVGQGDGAEDGEDTFGGGFEEAAARLEFVLFLFHNFNIPYRLSDSVCLCRKARERLSSIAMACLRDKRLSIFSYGYHCGRLQSKIHCNSRDSCLGNVLYSRPYNMLHILSYSLHNIHLRNLWRQ